MKPILLMLDVDGTLLDTQALFFEGMPRITERFLGMAVSREEILAWWSRHSREHIEDLARRHGDGSEALVDAMYGAFQEYYALNHNLKATAFDGVEEFLPKLRAIAHKLGIVTTRSRERAELVLDLPWGKHFDFLVCSDDVKHRKPAPDSLDFAVERYGDGAMEHIYLGDAESDMRAARASRYRITAAAALWGPQENERVLATAPDLAFETFGAFGEWLITRGEPCLKRN